jgi:hypothetical protein
MKKLIVCLTTAVIVLSTVAQSKAPNKKLTTVLGVSVGMEMKQTLSNLQERSKRFHRTPTLGSNTDSLGLLLNLQMKNVRLGWQLNTEMIASLVQITFFKGKVIQIAIQGDEDGLDSEWEKFLSKIPNTTKLQHDMTDDGTMINPIEHGRLSDKLLIVTDADNWNEFLSEKKRLEEFFNSVPRQDEVLD